MTNEALAMLENICSHWTSPESDEVMRMVRKEVESGAVIEQSFPYVRELKIVLPRRVVAVEREGLSYHGFNDLMANVLELKDDEKLLCFFIIRSDYMFAAYFRQEEMSFVGCLHGFRSQKTGTPTN